MERARADGVAVPRASAERAAAGKGVAARVATGSGDAVGELDLRLGSARWMDELGVDRTPLAVRAQTWQGEGRTVAWLAEVGGPPRLLGLLAFGDRPRAGAAAAIRRLQAQGLRTVMVSGDSRASAEALARTLGIAEVHAEVLPADKAALVDSLRAEQADRRVAMVGDGINDAPALAAADVGIAMGSGADVAMHAAGITLMRPDPLLVADALDLSRRCVAKIRQNLFWAFVYNVLGIAFAAAGLLSPVIAGAAMAFSSVSVVTNALALRRWRPAPREAAAQGAVDA
jgi:Cu+-exporting ATPase